MNRRKSLTEAMARLGMTVPQYAAKCGVSQSAIYKFLNGRDLWLSTWDKIDPSRIPMVPPTQDSTLPAQPQSARIIS